MAGVAAAVVGGLALAGGAAARGLGESRSWMESIVEEAKAQVRRSVPSFLPPPLEPPAPPPRPPPPGDRMTSPPPAHPLLSFRGGPPGSGS